MAEARMARQSPIVKTNKEVIGRKVINAQGENLGKVEEIMIDAMPGRSCEGRAVRCITEFR